MDQVQNETFEKEIPMKKAIIITGIVLIAVIVFGIIVGYLFFWNQFDKTTQDQADLKSYENVVASTPKNYKGYLALGNYYLRKDNPKEAMKYFKKAEALKKNDPLVMFNIGLAKLSMKQYDEAIKMMEPLAQKSTFNYDAQYYLGAAYYLKGNYQKAIECFKLAISYNGAAADGYLFLAKAQYKNGEKKLAEESLAKALRMVPNWDEALKFKKALEENKPIDE